MTRRHAQYFRYRADDNARVSVLLTEETMNSETRVVGRIIKIHKDGWGFISSREIEFTRIFFHWTALRQNTLRFPELKTGMVVEFTPLEIPEKGYRAMHIFVTDKREAIHESEDSDVPEVLEQGSDTVGTAE